MTAYLTLEDAKHVIDVFGFHIRDPGLLGSALARPRTTLMGEEAYPTLELKAASLLDSLGRYHPLIDGNKRTAWTLMVVFLGLNGYRHNFSTETAFELVVGVASGTVDLESSSRQIADHLVRWEE